MFIQLGTYKFENAVLPQSWSSSNETVYAQIPIINGKPVLQAVGEALAELSISVYFSAEFCNPQAELDKLNQSRSNREILPMISGSGRNFGKFVISKIDQDNSVCNPDGSISGMSVSISLIEYNSYIETKATGKALTSSAPVTEVAKIQPKGIALSIQSDIDTGKTSASQISKDSQTQPTVGKFNKIKENAQKAKDAFNSANEKINKTKKLVYRVQGLYTALGQAQTAADLVRVAAESNSFDDLMNANVLLEGAVNSINDSSAPLAAFIGSREGGE